MSIDPHTNNNTATILLHGISGRPLLLRQKFIIAALRGSNEEHTEITIDGGKTTQFYRVREDLHEIPGAFARLPDFLFNPTYFLSVLATGKHQDNHKSPWKITLRGPEQYAFNSLSTPEEVQQAIIRAGSPKL